MLEVSTEEGAIAALGVLDSRHKQLPFDASKSGRCRDAQVRDSRQIFRVAWGVRRHVEADFVGHASSNLRGCFFGPCVGHSYVAG